MDDKVVERIKTRDNLWAEEHVSESVDESGRKVRVKELFVEKKNPVHLQERVTEKLREDVYERTIDVLDENGNVVDRRVESVDPASARMHLVEHIAKEQVDSDNCNVTKEELVNMFVQAVQAVRDVAPATSVKGLQAELEERNETKSGGFDWLMIVLGVAVVIELGLFGWYMFG